MPISHTYSEQMIRAINAKLPINPHSKFGFTLLDINRNCGHSLVGQQPPLKPHNYDIYQDFYRQCNLEYKSVEEWHKEKFPSISIPTFSSSSPEEQNKYCHTLISLIVTDIITKALPDNPAFQQQNYIDSLVKIHLGVLERAYHQNVGCSPLAHLHKISEFFPDLIFKTEQEQTIKHLYYDRAKQTWILKVHSTVTFVTDQPNPNPLFNKIALTTFSHLGPFQVFINPDGATKEKLGTFIDYLICTFQNGFILKQIIIEAEIPYLEIFNKLLFWNSVEHPDFLKFWAEPLRLFTVIENNSSFIFGLSSAQKLYKLITENNTDLTFTGKDITVLGSGRLKQLAVDLRPAIYFKAPQLFTALGYNFNYIPSFIFQQEQFLSKNCQ